MAIFTVPEEYYGLGGIANTIGTFGQGQRDRIDRNRKIEREDFVFDEAKKDALRAEEDRIIRDTGQGSEAHLEFRKANNLSTEGILVPLEVRQSRRLSELLTIPKENLTRLEEAEINVLQGRQPEGIAGQLAKYDAEMANTDLMHKVNELTLRERQLDADQRERARTILATQYKTTPEAIDALMSITAMRQAEANLRLTGANINATNAQAENYRASAAENTAGATGYSPVEMRNLAARFNNSGVMLNGKPVTSRDVQAYLTGTMSPQDKIQLDRGGMKLQLEPLAAEAQAEVERIRKEIAKLEASKAVTLRQKESPSRQEAIDAYDAQIAGYKAEETEVRNAFTAKREQISRVPAGTVVQQLSGRSTQTGTNAPANFDPIAYVTAAVERLGKDQAKAAIAALPDSDPNKAKMLAVLNTPEPSAVARTAAPARTTPARPSEPARPAAGETPNREVNVNLASFFDRVRSGLGRNSPMDDRALQSRMAMGEKLVAAVRERAASMAEESKTKEIRAAEEELRKAEERIATDDKIRSGLGSPSMDRRIFDMRLAMGKKLAAALQNSGITFSTMDQRIHDLRWQIGEELAN